MNLIEAKYVAPFGQLTLFFDENDVVYYLAFENDNKFSQYFAKNFGVFNIIKSELSALLKSSLNKYFAGDIDALNQIKTKTFGTDFQTQAWEALKTIKAGKTASYQEQANKIGNPKAVRAVGGANNKNPIAIIIPCHRVIGKNGKMVGFGGGIDTKEWLLSHEEKYEKSLNRN